jgi:hypothetical protein
MKLGYIIFGVGVVLYMWWNSEPPAKGWGYSGSSPGKVDTVWDVKLNPNWT